MEELTEVITAAEFHPLHCNVLVYSSSKGTVRLCDMRDNALCDRYAKCKLLSIYHSFRLDQSGTKKGSNLLTLQLLMNRDLVFP